MTRHAAVLLCLLCTTPGGSHGQGVEPAGLFEPSVLTDAFDGDSLGQWASYPPAQDVGYEPSLTPTTAFDAPGGRALMRVVKPIVPGPLEIGFIQEVRLVVSPSADLALSYRLEPSALSGAIELGLAGRDGRRYTHRLPAASGAWTTITSRWSAFRDAAGQPPREGTGVEAVYVVAHIDHASPDITSRLLLDDVRLSASREARFDVREPLGRQLEPWAEQVSNRVYRHGDRIGIEAHAPVALARATWLLTGPSGQPIGRGELRGADRAWHHASAHQVSLEDPRGVWRLRLEGKTADGRILRTDVRLLVAPPRAGAHPRLYFDADDVVTLRARRQHPALAELWAGLRKSASAARETGPIAHGGDTFARLDSTYLLPTLLGYFDVLNRGRARISTNAFVGLLDDDAAARQAARTALLEVASWQTWVPPWFEAHGQHTYYPVGQLASAVAFAYDVLHDELSADERRRVRRALLERAILPTWREYVLDNRIMADTSNWISHTVGGSIIAAAAIFGDGTEEEDEALALPLNGLLMKIEDHMAASFLKDGSYGEGISYLEFDLETLGPMLYALERVFGQSYWERTQVRESLQYHLHTLADPIGESLDMGDTHPPGGHNIQPVIARSDDPVLRWLGDRFERRTIYDFLFFDERVAPRPPSGSGSRIFAVKGNAVFRTGWTGDDGLVLFRAGPTFNHNHSDQGSFQFRALGETLVTEAGWSDYYKDPYYDTFYTQAAGHNTLLVDGNPASQDIGDTPQFAALDRYPRITDATVSATYDAVGSDLTSVYRGRLQRYVRRLVYLKPDVLVVFDRVRSSGEAASYTWRLHVPSRDGLTVKTSGPAPNATYGGEHAAMAIQPLSSAPIALKAGDGHIPYPVFAARTPPSVPPQPAFLDIVTATAARDAWFMVALVPAETVDAATAKAADLTPLTAAGWTGMSMMRDGARTLVAFSVGDASSTTNLEQWRTDAEAWVATLAGTEVRQVGAQQVREVHHDDRLVFESDQEVSIALDYSSTGLTGSIDAEAPSSVRVRVPRSPSRVTLDGRAIEASRMTADGVITLKVPVGRHSVSMTWTDATGRAASARAGQPPPRLRRPAGALRAKAGVWGGAPRKQ